MLNEFKKIAGLITISLLILIFLVFIPVSCEVEPDAGGPLGDGTPTGDWHNSPEDSVVKEMLNEFQAAFNYKPRVVFYEGDAAGFVNHVSNTYAQYNQLDFVAFYSCDLDLLISSHWLDPYPESINENEFTVESVNGMKRNNTLYGIPIYVKSNGCVKGIGISSKMEDSLKTKVMQWINFVTSPDNSLRITETTDGTPALISLLPDLVAVPDSFGYYCIEDQFGNLIVTVKNQGMSRSGSSMTEVDFYNYGVFSLQTPSLEPGEYTELSFEFPDSCYDPVCTFQITVDVNNEIPETDEENNIIKDSCE